MKSPASTAESPANPLGESGLLRVLEQTGIGIWQYDCNQDRLTWSAALCALLSYAQAPANLGDWLALVHPDERAAVEAAMAGALVADAPYYQGECRLRQNDGEWLWVQVRGGVVERDGENRPRLFAGTLANIAERKYAEKLIAIQHAFAEKLAALPDREALQQAMLDSALMLPEMDGGGLYWRRDDGGYGLVVQRGLSAEFVAAVGAIDADSPRAALIRKGEVQTSCCPACAHCGAPTLNIGPELRAEGIQALVVMPVQVGEEVLACLNLASKHTARIGGTALTALDTLTHQFGQALERHLAREQSLAHEEDLRELFATLRDYLIIVDLDGRIVHYNRAVADDLGYGDTLLGEPIFRLHPPETRVHGKKMIDDLLAGHSAFSTVPLLRADGTRLDADIRVVRGHWGGRPVIVGIARDVSELLRQQDALRAEKRFSDDIINSLPGLFYMFDVDGRFVRWNHQMAITSGYSGTRLPTMHLTDLFDGEDRQRVAYAMQSVFENGTASVEAELRCQDGRRIAHFFSGRRTLIDGRPYMIGLAIDISGEREMKCTLLKERAFLKAVVETIPDLVWMKDPDGVYLICNPTFERFFGAPAERIVGRRDADFLPPEEVAFFRAHDLAAMAAGKPTRNEEWITFADDGHRALLETIKTPMVGPDGKVIGVLGIARDITALRTLQEAHPEE